MKMKNLATLLVAGMAAFSLMACGNGADNTGKFQCTDNNCTEYG